MTLICYLDIYLFILKLKISNRVNVSVKNERDLNFFAFFLLLCSSLDMLRLIWYFWSKEENCQFWQIYIVVEIAYYDKRRENTKSLSTGKRRNVLTNRLLTGNKGQLPLIKTLWLIIFLKDSNKISEKQDKHWHNNWFNVFLRGLWFAFITYLLHCF